MTHDPLGLERCLICQNAFSYDAAAVFDSGFVCKQCMSGDAQASVIEQLQVDLDDAYSVLQNGEIPRLVRDGMTPGVMVDGGDLVSWTFDPTDTSDTPGVLEVRRFLTAKMLNLIAADEEERS